MRTAPTALAVTGLALFGAACASAKPKSPPPTVPGVRSAPPPAWVETRLGDRWLAYSSFCWTVTCIDSRPLAERPDIPRLRVTRGELLRFHLEFVPSRLTVRVGSRTYTLARQRVASWRASGKAGFAVLEAQTEGKRAEYVARLVYSR